MLPTRIECWLLPLHSPSIPLILLYDPWIKKTETDAFVLPLGALLTLLFFPLADLGSQESRGSLKLVGIFEKRLVERLFRHKNCRENQTDLSFSSRVSHAKQCSSSPNARPKSVPDPNPQTISVMKYARMDESITMTS
jgi:hypothetical protein